MSGEADLLAQWSALNAKAKQPAFKQPRAKYVRTHPASPKPSVQPKAKLPDPGERKPVRFWPALLNRFFDDFGASERTVAKLAGINRTTLRRMRLGESPGIIEDWERLLSVFGYELEAMEVEAVRTAQRRLAEDHKNPIARSRIAAQALLAIGIKRRF